MNRENEEQNLNPEENQQAAAEETPALEMSSEETAVENTESETTEEEVTVEVAAEAATEEVPAEASLEAQTEETTEVTEAVEVEAAAPSEETAAVEATDESLVDADLAEAPTAMEAALEAAENEEAPEPQQAAAEGTEGAEGPEAPSAPHFTLPPPSALTALDLVPVLEAILFAADRPVSIDRFRQVIAPKPEEDAGPETEAFVEALETIRKRTENQDCGYELREATGGFHFVTRAPFSEYIRRYQASKPFRLGRAALETLSIIAYRQPVARAEIDQIRGMDSSHLMRTLIERGLVRMVGKAELPGRPVIYGTTPRFLEVMGLNSLNDLAPLSELKQLEGDVDDPVRRMEAGLDRFMQPDPHAVQPVAAAPVEGQEPGFDPGLSEIDSLIQSAGKPQEEVFVSAVHRDVALANQEALEAFQASTPRRRRKTTVTYDELVGSEGEAAPGETAGEKVELSQEAVESEIAGADAVPAPISVEAMAAPEEATPEVNPEHPTGNA